MNEFKNEVKSEVDKETSQEPASKLVEFPDSEDTNVPEIAAEEISRFKRLRREKKMNADLLKFDKEEPVDESFDNRKIPNARMFEVADEFPIDSFNMKDETRTGRFDSQGYYIFETQKRNPADEEEVTDSWLASIDENPEENFAKVEAKKDDHDEDQKYQDSSLEDLLSQLANLLEPNETPTMALRRFSKNTRLEGRKKVMEPASLQSFNAITDITNMLILRQDLDDILNLTREKLVRLSGSQPQSGKGSGEEMYWQYRWLKQKVKGQAQIYGPSSSQEVLNWINCGYISDKNPIELREVLKNGEPTDGVWRLWTDIRFTDEVDVDSESEKPSSDIKEFLLLEKKEGKNLKEETKKNEDEDEDDDDEDYGL